MAEHYRDLSQPVPKQVVNRVVRQLDKHIRRQGMQRVKPECCPTPNCRHCVRRVGACAYGQNTLSEFTLWVIAEANGVTLQVSKNISIELGTSNPCGYTAFNQIAVCILPRREQAVIQHGAFTDEVLS